MGVAWVVRAVAVAFTTSVPNSQKGYCVIRRGLASVSGTVYSDERGPNVQLFTKEGCTLCDKVKDVLATVKEDYPHR